MQVVREDGTVLAVGGGNPAVLERILPEFDERDYPTLRFVDRYGDTYFNHGQVRDQFLPEWQRLVDATHGVAEQRALVSVAGLAEMVVDGVHLYLKFVGD